MRSLYLLPLLAAVSFAQVDPAALRLLELNQSALAQVRSAEIEVDNTGILASTGRPITIASSIVWSFPDKVRLTIGNGGAGETTVTDGQHLTVYTRSTHEFTVRDGALPIAAAQKRAFGSIFSAVQNAGITSARVVQDETLSVSGTTFDCAVLQVEVHQAEPEGNRFYNLWIDKRTGLTLKQTVRSVEEQSGKRVETSGSVIVRTVRLNGPVDQSEFTFIPPAGAKRVEQARLQEGSNLIGRDFPRMDLRTLDGPLFDIASFRGKTIFLSFGTSACEPWKTQTAILKGAMANQAGIAVFLVDLNESSQSSVQWQKEHAEGLPMLAAQTNIFGQCPMNVVIDKAGKVVAAKPGVQQRDQALRLLKTQGASRP